MKLFSLLDTQYNAFIKNVSNYISKTLSKDNFRQTITEHLLKTPPTTAATDIAVQYAHESDRPRRYTEQNLPASEAADSPEAANAKMP